MLSINEVEMVDSLEELKSWRSVYEKDSPNFEMLNAKSASALKKVSLEEQRAPKEDRFLSGNRSPS